ncbi:hypothetical protein OBBRIDRAFT_512279 [Obba rivulosa]|uniref:Uncharacterized protein n=1 Tax=Obba rivulosa TaxID=1052685 RepID=A0A8E2AVA5_9APHY|nr:hypothetical protein OBBRIDRAFT_512279 [Obba rivulosa]
MFTIACYLLMHPLVGLRSLRVRSWDSWDLPTLSFCLQSLVQPRTLEELIINFEDGTFQGRHFDSFERDSALENCPSLQNLTLLLKLDLAIYTIGVLSDIVTKIEHLCIIITTDDPFDGVNEQQPELTNALGVLTFLLGCPGGHYIRKTCVCIEFGECEDWPDPCALEKQEFTRVLLDASEKMEFEFLKRSHTENLKIPLAMFVTGPKED